MFMQKEKDVIDWRTQKIKHQEAVKKLKEYFPMIREREEILQEIQEERRLVSLFYSWSEERREEFLNFCSGEKGINLLYDGIFKEIMSPEYVPERLNDFLSLVLGRKVRVHAVLPNDGTRIADESSLLVTDIIVELEDGSLANVEVQKIGYKFPGERSACYSADMLLRQYKRIRSVKREAFSYKDIKSVYTIILFEKSTGEFHQFPEHYIHYFEQRSDTGIQVELLQKYVFISLDLFRKIYQNKNIDSKREAWMMFFGTQEPEEIVRLLEAYPEFRSMYEEAYRLCQNTEAAMGFFSEELRELDRNTVQLMIDEMQDELNGLKAERDKQRKIVQEQKMIVREQEKIVQEQEAAIQEQANALQEKDRTIEELKRQLAQLQK